MSKTQRQEAENEKKEPLQTPDGSLPEIYPLEGGEKGESAPLHNIS